MSSSGNRVRIDPPNVIPISERPGGKHGSGKLARKAGVLGLLLVAATARAQSTLQQEPVFPAAAARARLRYRAPLECPSADSFVSQVRARTNRFDPVAIESDEEAGAAGTFVVAISRREGQGYEGVLRVERGPSAPPAAERTIAAPSCPDAFAALVLMVALAVDPNATLPAEPPKPEPQARPVAGAAAAPVAPAAPDERDDAPPRPPQRNQGPARSPKPFSLGIEGLAIGGIAPRVALGGGAIFEWRPPWPRIPALFQLSAGFVTAGTSTIAVPPPQDSSASTAVPRARFDVPFARAAFCLGVPSFGTRLALRPCAAFLGTLTFASGDGVTENAEEANVRVHGELGARLDWQPVPDLIVYAGAFLLTPIYGASDRYVFRNPEPGLGLVQAYEIPRIAAGGRAGIAVPLP